MMKEKTRKLSCLQAFGGESGIRTLGPLRDTAFRVLWVNGSLVIFEGCLGKFCIRRNA